MCIPMALVICRNAGIVVGREAWEGGKEEIEEFGRTAAGFAWQTGQPLSTISVRGSQNVFGLLRRNKIPAAVLLGWGEGTI